MKNKKEKGFTLIELLAIIVILAIIAVITVPIILNVIDNAKKGSIKDSAYGYKDAINKYYVSELYDNQNLKLNGTYTITDKGRLSNETGVHEIPFTGTTPTGGYLTYENNILKDGCITIDEYKVTISDGEITTVENGSCGELPKAITIIDQAEEGKIQAGDELAIGIEHFYVVSSDENETALLAKYNLNVGNNTAPEEYGKIGFQNSLADCETKNENGNYQASVVFSSEYYWAGQVGEGLKYPGNYSNPYSDDPVDQDYPNVYDSNNNAYEYIQTYKTELEKFGATIKDARLLTYQEAKNLGCDGASGTCTLVPERNKFVYSATYSLGSARYLNLVWRITTSGAFIANYFSYDYYGVRPVIVVNTSDIL